MGGRLGVRLRPCRLMVGCGQAAVRRRIGSFVAARRLPVYPGATLFYTHVRESFGRCSGNSWPDSRAAVPASPPSGPQSLRQRLREVIQGHTTVILDGIPYHCK